MKQAVILAGGKGTRLRSVMGDVPKPLAEVGGVSLLGHQLNLVRRQGFEEALVLINYGAEHMASWLAAQDFSPLRVRFIDDGQPKGTAGAVLAVFDELAEEFAVLYADTMVEVDFGRFHDFHAGVADSAATLFLHPNDHPSDSDLVEIDGNGRILRFHPYPHPEGAYLPNLVNAALYIVRKAVLRPWLETQDPLDFAKHLFPAMLDRGLTLLGYNSPEYIKDAGTPARLEKVRAAYESGLIVRASLGVKQRAIFIDRDGTLNEERGQIARAEDLVVFDGVGPALRRLNDNEWRSVIITNQPVLARGEASESDLRRIHARLDTEVARDHAFFDRIYVCPHHPHKGYVGEVAALKIVCDCRKPEPGLIHRAAIDLNIDLSQSWMIGDSTADIGAAERVGVSTIIVGTGNAGQDEIHPYEPTFRAANFASAVGFILDTYPKLQAIGERLLEALGDREMIFVAGLSALDTSTIAATLARELRRARQKVSMIDLDRWRLSAEGNYDHDGALATLRHAMTLQAGASGGGSLALPYFSNQTGSRTEKILTLPIANGDHLVVAGPDALELARALNLSSACVVIDDGRATLAGRDTSGGISIDLDTAAG